MPKKEDLRTRYGLIALLLASLIFIGGSQVIRYCTGGGSSPVTENNTAAKKVASDVEFERALEKFPSPARTVYAIQIEDDLRKAGSDVSVSTTGKDQETLLIKAKAVITDTDAVILLNAIFSNRSLVENLTSYGFKEVVLASGEGKETWRGYDTWTRQLPHR